MTIFYPDYSSFQGQATVPAGTPAIVAKATEGTHYIDADYGYYKSTAERMGIPFSGYHFLKADIDPAAQALYYYNFAGSTPCMLDVETENSSKPNVDQVLAFMTALKGHGGRVWGVYFPQWYWGQVGGDLSRLEAAGAGVISSNYTSYSDGGPGWTPYGGAHQILAWQYTSTPIDMNAFKGTPAQLAATINGSSSGAEVNLTDTITFSPAVVQQFPELAAEGFGGSANLATIFGWMAARVAHLVNQVNDLENKVNAGSGGQLNAQQVADLVIAELKAKL